MGTQGQPKARRIPSTLPGKVIHPPFLLIQECLVCFGRKQLYQFPQRGHLASHAICNVCMGLYLYGKIVKEKLDCISCPGATCKVELNYEEVKAHTGPITFARYTVYQKWLRQL